MILFIAIMLGLTPTAWAAYAAWKYARDDARLEREARRKP